MTGFIYVYTIYNKKRIYSARRLCQYNDVGTKCIFKNGLTSNNPKNYKIGRRHLNNLRCSYATKRMVYFWTYAHPS